MAKGVGFGPRPFSVCGNIRAMRTLMMGELPSSYPTQSHPWHGGSWLSQLEARLLTQTGLVFLVSYRPCFQPSYDVGKFLSSTRARFPNVMRLPGLA